MCVCVCVHLGSFVAKHVPVVLQVELTSLPKLQEQHSYREGRGGRGEGGGERGEGGGGREGDIDSRVRNNHSPQKAMKIAKKTVAPLSNSRDT